jgi:hypothetical protein
MMHEKVIPWMYDKIMDFLQDEDFVSKNVNDVILDSLKISSSVHKDVVRQEHTKLEAERREKERIEREKEEAR